MMSRNTYAGRRLPIDQIPIGWQLRLVTRSSYWNYTRGSWGYVAIVATHKSRRKRKVLRIEDNKTQRVVWMSRLIDWRAVRAREIKRLAFNRWQEILQARGDITPLSRGALMTRHESPREDG